MYSPQGHQIPRHDRQHEQVAQRETPQAGEAGQIISLAAAGVTNSTYASMMSRLW